MARIRTIKPEFYTSEQIVECSPIARLLFIGIWNFSDDNGIHPASIKRLKMEIFPADDFDLQQIGAMVAELIQQRLIGCYSINGQPFWIVTGWKSHQRIDKPNPKFKLPETADSITFDTNSTTIPGMLFEQSNRERNGKEWNGREWKGKPLLSDSQANADGASVNNPNGENVNSAANPQIQSLAKKPIPPMRQLSGKLNGSSSSKASILTDEASAILAFLNEKTGRHFRPTAANIDLIRGRLKEGYTIGECKAVIYRQSVKWKDRPEMQEYLRPKTLFGKQNFSQYVGEVPPEKSENNEN